MVTLLWLAGLKILPARALEELLRALLPYQLCYHIKNIGIVDGIFDMVVIICPPESLCFVIRYNVYAAKYDLFVIV